MNSEALCAVHSTKVHGQHKKGSLEILIPVCKTAPEVAHTNGNGTEPVRESILNIQGESWFGSAYFEANETNILKTLQAATVQFGDRPDNLKIFTIVFSEHAWAIKAE